MPGGQGFASKLEYE
jgi:hypothetical protein